MKWQAIHSRESVHVYLTANYYTATVSERRAVNRTNLVFAQERQVHEYFDRLRVGRHQDELCFAAIQRLRGYTQNTSRMKMKHPLLIEHLFILLYVCVCVAYLRWRPSSTA